MAIIMSHLVYHFTHVNNLPKIFKAGCLCADNLLPPASYTCVGNKEIKRNRKDKQIPSHIALSPCCVGDCVPFYYAPCSPMLYVISQGYVPGYDGGQECVVYFVFNMETLWNNCTCYGTDANAANHIANFYNDYQTLETAIDWPLMKARWWNDTEDDSHRKARRMAEFLVHQMVPLTIEHAIAVQTDTMKQTVEAIVQNAGYHTPVFTKPNFYY